MRKRAATNAAKREARARDLLDESDDEDSDGDDLDSGPTSESPPDDAATDPEDQDAGSDGPTPLPEHQTPATPDGDPRPKAQRNFTDPDSRIMEHPGGFIQGYNGQVAVDEDHPVIVAAALTNQAPDTYPLVPLLERESTPTSPPVA